MVGFVCAALLVFACAAPASALDIWCWGDSISVLYCPDLAQLRPQDVVENYGLGGETTFESLSRARDTIAQATTLPDVVVIELGTNDVLQVASQILDETADEAADNVAALRQAFLDAGVPYVVTTTTIIAPFAGNRSQWIRTYRARLRAMTPWTEFRFVSNYLAPDKIHPSPWGQLKLAKRVSRAITRAARPRR